MWYLVLYRKVSSLKINTGQIALAIFSIILIFHTCFYIQLKQKHYVFESLSVPNNFLERGVSNDYVGLCVDMMVDKIVNYERPIRADNIIKVKKELKLINTLRYSNSLNDFKISNDALGVGVTFKQLIYLTDRVLGLFGFDVTKNYISVNFFYEDNRLFMSALFQNQFKEMNVDFRNECQSKRDSLYYLCYNTALFITEAAYPDKLAEYYYNIGDYKSCAKVCVNAICKFEHEMEKEKVASLYTYWAFCLTYDPELTHKDKYGNYIIPDERERDIISKINVALALNPEDPMHKINKGTIGYYLYALRAPKIIEEYITKNLYLDVLNSPKSEQISSLISYYDMRSHKIERMPDNAQSSFYIDSIVNPLRRLVKTHHEFFAPETYFYIAKIISTYSHVAPGVLDYSIDYYKRAIQYELDKNHGSAYKLSEYYNSLAFAYEKKGLDTISEFKTQRKDFIGIHDTLLSNIKFNVLQAIRYYPQNPWPYTTLAEYWAIKYINSADTTDFVNARQACKDATKRGLDISTFFRYEPYYSLYSHDATDFKKMQANSSHEKFSYIMTKLRIKAN